MARKVLVFAGTTEGRNISEYLVKCGVNVTASVATEYGHIVMKDMERLRVRVGRLDLQMMKDLVKGFDFVIDATHPYAAVATRNIREACEAAEVEYFRLIRPSSEYGGAVLVEDADAAAEYLNNTAGNILITTGSKELALFSRVDNYQKRCFARVLPTVEAIESCNAMGLKGENIICMQGPFSHLMNLATIKETNAKYLVTKDSGAAGGISEKLSAAAEAGITAVMISRPKEGTGFGYGQLTKIFDRRFGVKPEQDGRFPVFIDVKNKKIIIIGGGNIAARRAEVLLTFGAQVTVISPELCGKTRELFGRGNISWNKKKYENGDVEGAALVVCATDDKGVNSSAAKEAVEYGILVSVADNKSKSTFYFPAIVQGGGVIGGFVSVGGENHPILREKAAQIRSVLNDCEK